MTCQKMNYLLNLLQSQMSDIEKKGVLENYCCSSIFSFQKIKVLQNSSFVIFFHAYPWLK